MVEALNLGANDYITKPVDFPVAMARIHGQLARKAAESALRESEERYALAARGSNDGLWDWDLASGRVYYSARWKAILGYLDGEIGEDAGEWLSRVHPEDLERLREVLRARAGRRRPARHLNPSTACATATGPIDGCAAAARRCRIRPAGSSGWPVR